MERCAFDIGRGICANGGGCPYSDGCQQALECDRFAYADVGVKTSAVEKQAAWKDVAAKARAIVAAGGVEIAEEDPNQIRAYVMSIDVADEFPVYDGGPYEVILSKRTWNNKKNVGGWIQGYLCDCKWGFYNSGQPGNRWRGRFCSHAYAALLESNARAKGDFMRDRAAGRKAAEVAPLDANGSSVLKGDAIMFEGVKYDVVSDFDGRGFTVNDPELGEFGELWLDLYDIAESEKVASTSRLASSPQVGDVFRYNDSDAYDINESVSGTYAVVDVSNYPDSVGVECIECDGYAPTSKIYYWDEQVEDGSISEIRHSDDDVSIWARRRTADFDGFDLDEEDKSVRQAFDDLVSMLESSSYEGLSQNLMQICSDPKLLELLRMGFGSGEFADMTMDSSTSYVPVEQLNPMQNEIGLPNSLAYPLSGQADPEMYFQPTVTVAGPIVTLNGTYIIDGHHRWSQLYMMNPDAAIEAVNFTCSNPDPEEALRVFQAAIAATHGTVPSNEGGVANVYAMSSQQIHDWIDGEMVEDCELSIIWHTDAEDREGAIQYLVDNAMSLPQPSPQAPDRKYMPQTDEMSLEVVDEGYTEV